MFNTNDGAINRHYSYVNDKPLHVSFGHKTEKHLQIMDVSEKRRHIPGKKAYGNKAKVLAEELVKVSVSELP